MEQRPSVQAALRISWISIAWGLFSGAASVAIGLSARSLALVASGASVLIDLSSSSVLVWRFRHPHGHLRAEQVAHQVAAIALLALSLSVAATSVARLVTGGEAHPSGASVAIAAVSLVSLPVIAARKYVVAARLPSPALTADAHITVVGALTALLSLLGLALTSFGLTSADSLAALVVAVAAGLVGGRELRRGMRSQ